MVHHGPNWRNASFWPASPSARAAPMAMEKARWAESALAQCEERGEAANARALLETSLAKYVEAFVTAKLTRDDIEVRSPVRTQAPIQPVPTTRAPMPPCSAALTSPLTPPAV